MHLCLTPHPHATALRPVHPPQPPPPPNAPAPAPAPAPTAAASATGAAAAAATASANAAAAAAAEAARGAAARPPPRSGMRPAGLPSNCRCLPKTSCVRLGGAASGCPTSVAAARWTPRPVWVPGSVAGIGGDMVGCGGGIRHLPHTEKSHHTHKTHTTTQREMKICWDGEKCKQKPCTFAHPVRRC